MPESTQPFAASEVPSNHDITHDSDIANDDLPELTSEEITDVELQFADDDATPIHFEPPQGPLPVAPVALARVSFNEQATLSFDGYQETFQVTLLNLSTQGVACLGPHGLNVADTVRLKFALAEGLTPSSLLCEVMWSQPSTPREDAYGLRFTAVDEHLLARVEDVVRQRCDSAAAACQVDGVRAPSIMATAVNSSPPPTPGMAPWVVAAAGAAAGMLVTLAVMVLVESDLFAAPVLTPAASLPVQGVAARAPGERELPGGAAGVAPGGPTAISAPLPLAAIVAAPDKSTPMAAKSSQGGQKEPRAAAGAPVAAPVAARPPAAAPVAAPVAASAPAAASAPVAASAPAAAPVAAPASATAAASAPDAAVKSAVAAPKVRFVGDLQVEESPRMVALTLRTNGPADLHEEFWLSSPSRLVVDVPAARNGLQSQTFDVASTLVARVRVGEHPDKVRFVIETKNVASKIRAKATGDALRIELRQRS